MHIGFLILLYFVMRTLYRFFSGYGNPRQILYRLRELLDELVSRERGAANRVSRRGMHYSLPHRRMQLLVDYRSRVRLTLRMEASNPFALSLVRVPRLPFAFLEAFLASDQRLADLPYFPFASSPGVIPELKQRNGFLELLQALERLHFSIRFDRNSISLSKTVRREDLNDAALQQMLQLAESLRQLCSVGLEPIPIQPIESLQKCAYCKEVIQQSELVTYCSLCRTPHHTDCFQLNGSCSVFGCASVKTQETPLTVVG